MGKVIQFPVRRAVDDAHEDDPAIDVHIGLRVPEDETSDPVPCLVSRHSSGDLSEVPISWAAVVILTDCNIPCTVDINLRDLRRRFGV